MKGDEAVVEEVKSGNVVMKGKKGDRRGRVLEQCKKEGS